MRIMGVDPGTIYTGIGVIESQGSAYQLVHAEVVRANSRQQLPERLHFIYTRLCEVTQKYQPEVLALENVFFGRDLQAMVKIGEARACAMLAAARLKIPVVEYAPARVKQAVTGQGLATKEQMQQMIRRLLHLKQAPDSDAADALAVAICHLHRGTSTPHSRNTGKSRLQEMVDRALEKEKLAKKAPKTVR